ncbi:MAG TPA: AAA family ATPase [Candidatus Methylomirabilis sp.]|nr:AAA family ATPase [Candidatus Methylomirabilis sp.]
MEKVKITANHGWPLAGNRPLTDFLEKSVAGGKVAHSYIFLGPRDLGKTAAAVFFAAALLCQKQKPGIFSFPCGTCASCRELSNRSTEAGGWEIAHGDFHLLKKEPDKKNISIEQVREFIRILEMSSFLNSYKVGIIKEADELSESAANALLKTLEEPRPKVVIILTATREEKIPATIVSRSQVLRFQPVSASVIYDYLVDVCRCPRTQAKEISRLGLGRPALAKKFFDDQEFYQNYLRQAGAFLDFFRKNLNERVALVDEIMAGADEEKTETALKVLNIWQGLARDLLLLSANNGDLIQHEPLRDKLRNLPSAVTADVCLKIVAALKNGEKFIQANVNPKLVLENIAINV